MYSIRRYSRRSWGVYTPSGSLLCVTVYLKGARAVVAALHDALALSAPAAPVPAPGAGVQMLFPFAA